MEGLFTVLFTVAGPFGVAACIALLLAFPLLMMRLFSIRSRLERPGLTAQQRDRILEGTGWEGEVSGRRVAGRQSTLVAAEPAWRLRVPVGDVELHDTALLRTHVDDDSRTGDPAFDEVVSVHFDGLASPLLHHRLRAAWLALEALGDPSLNQRALEVHFVPEAGERQTLPTLEAAIEAVFAALEQPSSLAEMVRHDPVPLVRRRAFDQLAQDGDVEDELLEEMLSDPEPALRVRARRYLDREEGLAEDALRMDPNDLVSVFTSGPRSSPLLVPAMLPDLLTQDDAAFVEAGVALTEHVWATAAMAVGRLAVEDRLNCTPEQQLRLAKATAGGLPPEALPWLAGLVGRLDRHGLLPALEQLQEDGTTALVPVLKEQAGRARLVNTDHADHIEATIRALQADARGDVGAVSIASSSGGDLGLAEPPPRRPEGQRE